MRNRQWYEQRAEMIREHGEPPFDPVQSLRHTLSMYADAPDDKFVVTATSNCFDDGVMTGLTWGDLRALAAQMGVDFRKETD